MIKKYIPYNCFKTIYDINYEELFNLGIRGLLFDIDNTILPYGIKAPEDKHVEFFRFLKEKGFKICLISNNNLKRVQSVSASLGTFGVARAFKPRKKGYFQALKLLDVNKNETVMIGDQMLTDIKGANNCNIRSILVRTIVIKKQKWYTKINRLREKVIIKKIKRANREMYDKLMKEVYFNET